MEILTKLFSGTLYSVVLFGVFAAVMSSADSFLNVASINFSKLIFSKKWEKYGDNNQSEKSLLASTKTIVVIVGIISIIIALIVPDIVDLFVASFSLILILLPATISAIFFDRPNSRKAFYSILGGFLTFGAIFMFFPGLRKMAFFPALLLSILLYVCMPKEKS
jgi:Na+/proline symporter